VARPRYTRHDKGQVEIAQALRRMGMVVWDLADLGGKVLDLLVCWRGLCIPVEIKAEGKRKRLTDNERASMMELAEVGVTAIVATTVDDVLECWPKATDSNVPSSGNQHDAERGELGDGESCPLVL